MKSKFTDKQKLKIVTAAFAEGGSATKASKKYKVPRSMIYNWKKRFGKTERPILTSDQLNHELKHLNCRSVFTEIPDSGVSQHPTTQSLGTFQINWVDIGAATITAAFVQEAVTKLLRERLGLPRHE